jgi:hypothetical protein
VRYGYRKIRALLSRESWDVGRALVYRLYKEEGLTLTKMRPQRKRKAVQHREERFLANGPNQAWSIDFVPSQLRYTNNLVVTKDRAGQAEDCITQAQALTAADAVRWRRFGKCHGNENATYTPFAGAL